MYDYTKNLIEKLENLNKEYYSGSMKEILSRCSLIGPFILDISNDDPNVQKALLNFFDVGDKYNMGIMELMIELYKTDGYVREKPVALFIDYPDYFNRMALFLLGEEEYKPDAEAKKLAETLTPDPLTTKDCLGCLGCFGIAAIILLAIL